MEKITKTYFKAEDGYAGFTDKESCLRYEAKTRLLKDWLANNELIFWNFYHKYMNTKLLSLEVAEDYSYLEALTDALQDCGYFSVLRAHSIGDSDYCSIVDFMGSCFNTEEQFFTPQTLSRLSGNTTFVGDIFERRGRNKPFANMSYARRELTFCQNLLRDAVPGLTEDSE